MKMNADGARATTKTKSKEELDLLRRIIAESKVFRKPPSENGQQSAKVKRKGVAGVANGDRQGRRGAV
ncbi:MAG: hypothetical protein ABSC05_39080 [Candidatus Solibacter sp.]|jgi:hypothetical protein